MAEYCFKCREYETRLEMAKDWPIAKGQLVKPDCWGTHTKFPSYLPDRIQQTEEEWKWLLEKMAGSECILEIGSCLGYSLRAFALHAIKGARLCSIDLGVVGPKENSFVTSGILSETIKSLLYMGYDAKMLIADSHSPEAIEWAREQGPYDFIYIDGDHSYEGVKADWENYGIPLGTPFGNLVGFHDINHEHHGVRRLWKELKEQGYHTDEKVASHQGTGLIYLDRMALASIKGNDALRLPEARRIFQRQSRQDGGAGR